MMKKILIFVSIFSLLNLILIAPSRAGLVPVIDVSNLTANTITATMTTAQKIQTFIIDFIIKPLIRKIANSLESQLINKVNDQIAGINGQAPSFITNWRNYLLDSQARGNDVFRAVLADSNLCPYFGDSLKTAFGADLYKGVIAGSKITNPAGENKTYVPGLPSFQTSANCSLPTDFKVDDFRNDFSKGGWQAWDSLIQPQNNFFGVYAMALNEQQTQMATEEKSSANSSVAGGGFLSQKLGAGGSGTGPTGCASVAGNLSGGVQGPTMTTRCTFMGKDITPGKLLSDSAANAIDAKLKRPGAATELTDIVLNLFASILTGVTSRLSNYVGAAVFDQGQYSEDVTAGQQDGGSQAQNVTNITDQAANQVKSAIPPPQAGGSTSSSACTEICLAGGTDSVACDTRCQ